MEPTVRLSIVVPTCNEEQNVRSLIDQIDESLGDTDFEVVFVDDSTDRTPEVVGKLMRSHKNIRLIHRQGDERKGGLAGAVIRGFAEANGTYICVMDADLQHPPQMIPALLEAASGSDIVIASRYCKGGSYEGLSGPFRKFVSVALKELARVVFLPRLNQVTDPLGGFFLVRRDILQGVTLAPIGFKILLEILVRCHWETVCEVPYRFAARADGKSKASTKQGFTFLLHVARLLGSVPSAGRFWKFNLVGGLVAIIGIGLLYFLVGVLSIEKNVAYFAQALVSLQLSFNLNYRFTWRETRESGGYWNRWAKFHSIKVLAVVVNQVLFAALLMVGMYYMLACVSCIAIMMGFNFLTSDRLVFSTRKVVRKIQ